MLLSASKDRVSFVFLKSHRSPSLPLQQDSPFLHFHPVNLDQFDEIGLD